MKTMLIFLAGLTSVLVPVFGQTGCAWTGGQVSMMGGGGGGFACGPSGQDLMIPEQTPIKQCRVIYHVIRQSDGSGSFQNNLTDIQWLNDHASQVNQRLGNLGQLNAGTSPYISDSRIRIVLESILFHNSNVLFEPTDGDVLNATLVEADIDNLLTDEQVLGATHIFIKGGTTVGGNTDPDERKWIVVEGWYGNSPSGGPVGNFIHEFGHVCGLDHNYQPVCDDCHDNDFAPPACPTLGSSNNFMDGYGGQGGPNGMFATDPGFSACQLSLMHCVLSGSVPQCNTPRTVVQDWCSGNQPLTIPGVYTWQLTRHLKGDLILEPGARLNIRSRIHFPSNARVIVKPGARLVLDGGTLTNACDEMWRGIELWGPARSIQAVPFRLTKAASA